MAIRGIYKITNPVGAVYIGQSVNCVVRLTRYKCLACSRQPKIYASLNKYGVENHTYEIVYHLPKDVSKDVMNNYEEFFVSQYKDCGFSMLNLTGGGHKNQDLHESTREKLRKAATGKKHWLGRKHTQETKDKIRAGNTGQKFTKERLKNMSYSAPAKLSYSIAEEIRSIYKNTGKTQKEISLMYGVTQSNIYKIVNNKSWTHAFI